MIMIIASGLAGIPVGPFVQVRSYGYDHWSLGLSLEESWVLVLCCSGAQVAVTAGNTHECHVCCLWIVGRVPFLLFRWLVAYWRPRQIGF